MRKQKIFMGVMVVAFIGSLFGVNAGFRVPQTVEREFTRVTYDLEATFSHDASGKPLKEKAPANAKYFTKIIESVTVNYNYRFVAENAGTPSGTVKLSAMVSNPGSWEKEMALVPETPYTGEVALSVPLDTAAFITLSDSINEQLGIGKAAPEVTLRATVHTSAPLATGSIDEDFIQNSKLKLSPTTIDWEPYLGLTTKGFVEGTVYRHEGNFSYSVVLKENLLFGAATLFSPAPVEPELVKIVNAASYTTDKLQKMDIQLSYRLNADEKVDLVESNVQVTAVLSSPGAWEKSLIVVPYGKQEGDFNLTIPLDMTLFYDVTGISGKKAMLAPLFELTIKADIVTTGKTEFGLISETMNPAIKLTLDEEKLQWPETEPEKKEGTIKEKKTVDNPDRFLAQVATAGLAVMSLIGLLWSVYYYIESRRKRVDLLAVAAAEARSKYKSTIVDVEELPPGRADEVLIAFGSLEELVKAADALLKPVLHKAEPDRHTYRIIDGTNRYEYVREREVREENPEKPEKPKKRRLF